MTFPSHFHMSGTFHDGVHPGLFRPPASPSSSTDYLPSSTLAAESSKRKWSRSSVPRVQTGSFFHDVYMESGPAAAGGAAAARSRTYALAGQLHTPVIGGYSEDVDGDGDGDADTAMGESMYSDSDYRRALGTKRSREDLDDSSGGPTPLFSQPEPSQSSQSGIWGTFSLSTIGDVVGRVWEFCKAGAFKGFYAGGGASYKVTTAGVSVDETGSSGDQTSNYDSSFDSRTSTPTGPASKKRRHTESGSELGQSWVMIQEPSREPEMTTPRKLSTSSRVSPRHRAQQTPLAEDHRMGPPSSFATPPTTSSPAPLRPASRAASRPGSRLADAASLFRTQQPASAASFASFKAPAAGKRRRHTIAPAVAEPSPLSGRRRRDSVASVATSRATEIDASPRLDAEARQLAARRQMEEDDTDKRMAAFNKQLQDMIRQGRAALGTTVEVDAGWEDAL
ncbi:uncharacterized protein TRIREDRAFT_23173 [Trichoderma reesei QM6a]|uniref:Predicted protein n=2 Tax=Hypocrea jecorina TaxID=51453 RepID=G0RTP0_HYPJQ|nr:uncharacterized protein TRIREDRAFT_23173 [Trichoderma reesei QM6a]EGR45466.1 predicted protein [Trichoderma reesei QM6a]ETR98616.1 hypothetical protein M419DRAFT_103212 [Trichoderma reesei RUT C-30]